MSHNGSFWKVCQVLHPSQVRAARASLGWSADQLAAHCGLSRKTVQRIETASDLPNITLATLNIIKSSLEAHGIEFITAPDGSPGIVIRSPSKT